MKNGTDHEASTWQNRERWLNKYADDEEEHLFEAFNLGSDMPHA